MTTLPDVDLPREQSGTLRALALFTAGLYAAGVLLFAVGFRMRGVLEYDDSGRILVERDSVAQHGGMASGDRLVSIGGAPVARFADIRPAVRRAAAGALAVRFERDGVVHAVTLQHDPVRGRLGFRLPVVRRDVAPAALFVRSAMEPAASWRRAYLNGLDLDVAPDADGPVSYAEFLRPKEAGDRVVSAGVVASHALLVPLIAAIAAGLGALSSARRRPGRT